MLKFQQENVDLTQDFHCFSEGKCIPFWGKNTFVRVHIQAIDANISARILWLEDDLDKKHEIFINTNSQTHSFILRGSEEILVSAEANLRSGKALVKKGADTAFLEFNPNIPFFGGLHGLFYGNCYILMMKSAQLSR